MRADARKTAPDAERERALFARTVRLNGHIVDHCVYADTEAGIVGHYVEIRKDEGGFELQIDPATDDFVIAEERGQVEIEMPAGWVSKIPE